jgi:hypothetical protein
VGTHLLSLDGHVSGGHIRAILVIGHCGRRTDHVGTVCGRAEGTVGVGTDTSGVPWCGTVGRISIAAGCLSLRARHKINEDVDGIIHQPEDTRDCWLPFPALYLWHPRAESTTRDT